ncbi:MAG: rubrerythrin family protein [Geobacter sp.]|nr:rubrerythrin family protein [Geobacter sp.]
MKPTANNTLQIAVEMERLGRTFYESLALGCGHAEIAALATSLAKAEEEHIETFVRMRNALPPDQRGPKLADNELFAATEVLHKKIIPSAKAVHKAVQAPDLLKVLDMAIEMETRAVDFYSTLLYDVTGLDAAVMAEIVDEEKAHVRMLQEVRKLLPG